MFTNILNPSWMITSRDLAEVRVQIKKTHGSYPNNRQMPFQIHSTDDLELSFSVSVIWLCSPFVICAVWLTLKTTIKMTEPSTVAQKPIFTGQFSLAIKFSNNSTSLTGLFWGERLTSWTGSAKNPGVGATDSKWVRKTEPSFFSSSKLLDQLKHWCAILS